MTIAPEVTSKTKSRDIMKFLSDSYGASHLGNLLLAYDGKKSAFAAGPLPFDSKEFAVKFAEENGYTLFFTILCLIIMFSKMFSFVIFWFCILGGSVSLK